MPMAPSTFPLLYQVLLAALFALALSAPASPANKDQAPFDVAAGEFLWACCANTTSAVVCYDSLLPLACSFQANRVKVAGAATAIAFARLRRFGAELRHLQREGGTGFGILVNRTLESCLTYITVAFDDEGAVLAKLRRLETAAGRRGKHVGLDLLDASLGLSEVGDSATSCADDFASLGGAVLASPLGKKVLSRNATVRLYQEIASELVASIKL
ncbi:hypothetical protein ACP70R_001317 [Stipagrostis hirtigluma subsp. patula]